MDHAEPSVGDTKSSSEEEDDNDLLLGVRTLGINRGSMSDVIYVHPIIEGNKQEMELDTGSAVAVIPKQMYNESYSDVPLLQTRVTLSTYTGEMVKPIGVMKVKVELNSQTVTGNLYVLESRPACSAGSGSN